MSQPPALSARSFCQFGTDHAMAMAVTGAVTSHSPLGNCHVSSALVSWSTGVDFTATTMDDIIVIRLHYAGATLAVGYVYWSTLWAFEHAPSLSCSPENIICTPLKIQTNIGHRTLSIPFCLAVWGRIVELALDGNSPPRQLDFILPTNYCQIVCESVSKRRDNSK